MERVTEHKLSAFERLVRTCDRRILRMASRITGTERAASNLYKEIFFRLHAGGDRIQDQESFEWRAFREAARRCLEYLERAETLAAVGSYDGSSVRHALAMLTPRERLVIDLKHYQGFSLLKIAEILDMAEAGVKTVLSRAVLKLSFALSESESENQSRK